MAAPSGVSAHQPLERCPAASVRPWRIPHVAALHHRPGTSQEQHGSQDEGTPTHTSALCEKCQTLKLSNPTRFLNAINFIHLPGLVLGPFQEPIDETRCPMCSVARYAVAYQDGHPAQKIYVTLPDFAASRREISLFKLSSGDP